MCGILALVTPQQYVDPTEENYRQLLSKLQHRGPDDHGIYHDETIFLGHTRLSIVDPEHGQQPMYSNVDDKVVILNGEIYNYQELRARYSEYPYHGKCDTEILLALFQGVDLSDHQTVHARLNELNGIFAFVIYDKRDKQWLIARDHLGIVPLYYSQHGGYFISFSSEIKGLLMTKGAEGDKGSSGSLEFEHYNHHKRAAKPEAWTIGEFPPGSFYCSSAASSSQEFHSWYQPLWMNPDYQNSNGHQEEQKEQEETVLLLEQAVIRQMRTDVPFGVLLSGGLDSSVIASLVVKHRKERTEDPEDPHGAWWPNIHTFSIGLPDSPDLKAAQKVADHLGTIHHSIVVTHQDIKDAVAPTVYYLETFDITTIRAGIMMYLLGKTIKQYGIKMVLSGEGSDELLAGYLYNKMAPNPQELQQEAIDKVKQLHLYDCLRANKAMMASGIECRVPFLDKVVVDHMMSLNPEYKMSHDKIEKHFLRAGFQRVYPEGLPQEVLWRVKEQFSDGVGRDHIALLQQMAENRYSHWRLTAGIVFQEKTPYTAEHYMYRCLFSERFPEAAVAVVAHQKSVACSSERALKWKTGWSEQWDPSGYAV